MKQKMSKEQKKNIFITVGIWVAALTSVAVLEQIVFMIGFDQGTTMAAEESIKLIKSTSPEAYDLLLKALANKKE